MGNVLEWEKNFLQKTLLHPKISTVCCCPIVAMLKPGIKPIPISKQLSCIRKHYTKIFFSTVTQQIPQIQGNDTHITKTRHKKVNVCFLWELCLHPRDSAALLTSGQVCFWLLGLLEQTIKGWRRIWSNSLLSEVDPIRPPEMCRERGTSVWRRQRALAMTNCGLRKLVSPIWKAERWMYVG